VDKIAILIDESSSKSILKEAEEFLKIPVVSKVEEHISYYVKIVKDRVQLTKASGVSIEVDFLSAKWNFKMRTLSKSQPLFKAVGFADQIVILDATLGMGEDAFSFLVKGARVTGVEKNPFIYFMVKNGFERLVQESKFSHLKENIELVHED